MPTGAPGDPCLPDRVHAFRLWSSPSLGGGVHRHEHHELIIPVRGTYRARFAGAEVPARPGQVVGYPAGQKHEPILSRRRGVEYLVVQWWGGAPPVAGVGDDTDGRRRMAAEWLIDSVAGGGPCALPVARLLAALLAQPMAPVAEEIGIIHRLRQEMRSKLEAPLSLGDLCVIAGWTPQHLIRRFRAETGCTPMAWFQEQRLRAARRLLESGHDLETAAQRCGYRHGRNLLRALRQHGL